MTRGTTPNFALPFPYGDEPVASIDDIWQEFATKVDNILHDAAMAQTVAYKLVWTGSYVMQAASDYEPDYLSIEDQSQGTGLVPTYTMQDGITVPRAGIYMVEAWSRFVNAATSPVVIDSTVVVNTVYTRANAMSFAAAHPSGIQISTPWTGYLPDAAVVRSRSRASGTGVTTTDQAIRLVGPLNIGVNL